MRVDEGISVPFFLNHIVISSLYNVLMVWNENWKLYNPVFCITIFDADKLSTTIKDVYDIDEEENDIDVLLNVEEEDGDCADNDFKFSFE